MSAVGTRDLVIMSAPVRTIDLTLPPYYKEIRIGTGHTPNGFAFEISSNFLYADNVLGGVSRFINSFYFFPAVTAITLQNQPAIQAAAQTLGPLAHGLMGENQILGTQGLVGASNGYDFYASGSGTNYGPFTGTHDAVIAPDDAAGAQVGDLVVDMECVYRRDVSNTLFRVKLCGDVLNKPAIGVICSINDWQDGHVIAALQEGTSVQEEWVFDGQFRMHKQTRSVPQFAAVYQTLRDAQYKLLAVNALGEGQVNVCGQNGDITAGDLIVVSSMPGKGMKQDDDILHSYTVARAREGCTFSGPTDVKTIACIYLSG